VIFDIQVLVVHDKEDNLNEKSFCFLVDEE
jgi:hypothetical protein